MRFALSLLTAAGLAGLAAAPAVAQSATEAAELFAKAAEHLQAQDAFTAKLALDYDLKIEDVSEAVSTDYTLQFSRPDDVSVALENEAVQARFVSTGDQLTTYISEFNGYTVEQEDVAPADVVAQSAYGVLTHGMFLLAELVKEEPFAGLLQDASDVTLVEDNHARFTHEGIQWDVWFEKSDGKLLLDRFSPDLTPMLADATADGGDASIALLFDVKEWSFEPVADDAFQFTAPEGIEEVASFRPPSPADALLGKPAPDFTLALLNGGELKLSEKPKDAVYILDFWATWCGPCRTAMPILEGVSGEFADKDVTLFAVNLQETPDEIKSFLKGEGLDVNVALDTDGEVSELYQVTGIPQTVIIGQAGTVQVVHIGVSPDLERQLRDELSKLVEGEKLARR